MKKSPLPPGVWVFGWLILFCSFINLAASFDWQVRKTLPTILIFLSGVLSLALIVAVIGLFQRKSWARPAVVIFLILMFAQTFSGLFYIDRMAEQASQLTKERISADARISADLRKLAKEKIVSESKNGNNVPTDEQIEEEAQRIRLVIENTVLGVLKGAIIAALWIALGLCASAAYYFNRPQIENYFRSAENLTR